MEESMETNSTTRRVILKTLAALPLALTFGLVGPPLLRYGRPTMKPLDVFGAPDTPHPEKEVVFSRSDFEEPWTCREFTFTQVYTQYNPDGQEIGRVPGYMLKLPNGDMVAYSRICPHLGCVFRFVEDPAVCEKDFNFRPDGPVFACPCHLSVYDIAQGGKVVSGPAPRPPRKFILSQEKTQVKVLELEPGSIA